jgi:hypothetical protein
MVTKCDDDALQNILEGENQENIRPSGINLSLVTAARKGRAKPCEEILNRFEKDYHETSSSKVDPDADPVNILCIGGGGMKGKKLLIVHLVSW